MSDFSIRVYREEDMNAVIALWRAAGLLRPWNDPEKDIARKLFSQPELFFVAERGGKIVGAAMCGYEGHRGSVNYLAVEPSLQGSGLGKALIKHIEVVLTARGCPKINLLVRSDNTQVLAFYASLGYEQDKAVALSKRLIQDE